MPAEAPPNRSADRAWNALARWRCSFAGFAKGKKKERRVTRDE